MEAKYVARQAILDRRQEAVAYEFLFRDGPVNAFRCDSISRATSSVIADSFLTIGLDSLTGGRPAFINFSHESLVQDLAYLLPPKLLVVEVLESVEPDAAAIDACRRLKSAGYTLALDDFEWSEAWRPLVEIADIVKIDFRATLGERRHAIAAQLRPFGLRLLAEKVETWEEFEDALAAGYDLFQGYLFSKPVIRTARDVRGFEHSHVQILRAVSSPDCDLKTLEELVRRDVALTYKIMRRVNSASFGVTRKTTSLRSALALLGVDEVRKWVALLVVAGLAKGSPTELVRVALLRAHFCEAAASCFEVGDRATDLFLAGLFSEIGTMLQRPLAEALDEIGLPKDLEAVLSGEDGPLASPLRCARAWERGDWDAIQKLAANSPSRGDSLPEAYAEALLWLRECQPLTE
ncbi:MAG: HDOD domain-containing protein [Deltaproteobacteria bacterium]|nr:HDOD domain-containing protein [Deltaproteobacteria bacterium]